MRHDVSQEWFERVSAFEGEHVPMVKTSLCHGLGFDRVVEFGQELHKLNGSSRLSEVH